MRVLLVEDHQPLVKALRPGDVVMVKGSLGTNMAPIVKALEERSGELEREFRKRAG